MIPDKNIKVERIIEDKLRKFYDIPLKKQIKIQKDKQGFYKIKNHKSLKVKRFYKYTVKTDTLIGCDEKF